MTLTTITLFLIKQPFSVSIHGGLTLIDPQSDVSFNHDTHALTWRRYGQDQPEDLDLVGGKSNVDYIWTFRTDENHTTVLSEYVIPQLIHRFPGLDDVDLIEAASAIFDKIREAQQTQGWEYRHSAEYFEAVEAFQFGRSELSEPLASWERELLNGGTSVGALR
ncbi:MAG: hypothetical protein WAQ27_00855 [Candidatus Microsaccharimonas sp.]